MLFAFWVEQKCCEQLCCKSNGLQSQKEIAKALRVFTQAENLPVLVHCMHGKDRTGVIIMLVMLLCDNGHQVEPLLLPCCLSVFECIHSL